MSTKTWIVVADKNQTRIFEKKQLSQDWDKVEIIKAQDHNHDGDSRSLGHAPKGDHPQDHSHDPYFLAVTDFINKSQGLNHFGELFVVAGPEALGHLRKGFSKEVEKNVKKTITKDLGHHDQNQLMEYLKDDFIFTGDLHK